MITYENFTISVLRYFVFMLWQCKKVNPQIFIVEVFSDSNGVIIPLVK